MRKWSFHKKKKSKTAFQANHVLRELPQIQCLGFLDVWHVTVYCRHAEIIVPSSCQANPRVLNKAWLKSGEMFHGFSLIDNLISSYCEICVMVETFEVLQILVNVAFSMLTFPKHFRTWFLASFCNVYTLEIHFAFLKLWLDIVIAGI